MRLDLATIFTRIQKAHAGMEATASQILEVVKINDANSLDKFNEMVSVAYDRNGWSRRQGRPKAGDTPAPRAVQVYVSTLRRAYKLGVKVIKCDNMQAVRDAITKLTRKESDGTPPELKGLQVAAAHSLNGGLYHDVITVRAALSAEEQQALDAAVQKLLDRYVKKAPPTLKLVA